MKRVVILLCALILPASAYSQPEIKFTTETHDMGNVTQETVIYSFEFQNTGTSELIIEKLVPS